MERVTCRNQAHFAAEFPQHRFRQTLYKRLALVARGALAHDQQVFWSVEFIIEGFPPGDLDRFGADAAPLGAATTHNIGRTNLNLRRDITRRPALELAHNRVSDLSSALLWFRRFPRQMDSFCCAAGMATVTTDSYEQRAPKVRRR